MKLNPSEQTLVNLLERAGGSICPDGNVTPEVHRLCRRLERKGVVTVEETDAGPRFTLTGAHNG